MNKLNTRNKKRTTINLTQGTKDQIALSNPIGTTYEEVLQSLLKSAKWNAGTVTTTTNEGSTVSTT